MGRTESGSESGFRWEREAVESLIFIFASRVSFWKLARSGLDPDTEQM